MGLEEERSTSQVSKDNLLEAASNLGAAGVLPKPFGRNEVLDEVARVLAAKK